MSARTAFSIGYADRTAPGGVWYLSRAWSPGNLMRTSDPFSAQTWATVAEVELWWLELKPECRKQLEDRELVVLPLSVTTGAAARSVWLKPRIAEVTK